MEVQRRCLALQATLRSAEEAEKALDLDRANVLTWQVLEETLGSVGSHGSGNKHPVPDEVKLIASDALVRAERLKRLLARHKAAQRTPVAAPAQGSAQAAGPAVAVGHFDHARVVSLSRSPERVRSREAERQSHLARVDAIEGECSRLKAEQAATTTEKVRLEVQLAERQAAIASAQRELQRLAREKGEAVADREARIEHLESSLAAVEAQRVVSRQRTDDRLSDLDVQLQERAAVVAAAQDELARKTAEAAEAEVEIDGLQAQIDDVNFSHREAQARIEGLQADLDAAKLAPVKNHDECVYCFEGDAVHAFVPCGHQCLCGDCAARATEMLDADGEISCYVCQVASSAVIRIYATS